MADAKKSIFQYGESWAAHSVVDNKVGTGFVRRIV